MFTGIVKGIGQVDKIENSGEFASFLIKFPETLLSSIQIGASISINGVCLTVTAQSGAQLSFDAIKETLIKTNLGSLKSGDKVNLERSAKFGDEIGGHILSGHIDGTAEIIKIEQTEQNCHLTFKTKPELMKYIFSKGFIALNGASLTLNNVDKSNATFQVWLIPETLRATTFSSAKVGDQINLELDRATQAIVETVERVMSERD